MPIAIRTIRIFLAAPLVFLLFGSGPLHNPAQAGEIGAVYQQSESEWGSAIRFYQNIISRADGNRCQMHPSCTHYAQDAFKKHNFFVAWMLTSDRLLRCGHDEIDLAPKVRIHGQIKAYDPLAANTPWWSKP